MNLLEQLLKQLAANGPDSAEVRALLEVIREREPASALIAETLVEKWRGQRTAPLPSLSWAQWGAVGGGVGLLAALPWLQSLLLWAQSNVPLPHVASPVALLLVVALVGGAAGFAYSVQFHRGVALPSLQAQAGVLALSRLGFLNELAFGALAAVTTVWLATIGVASPVPGLLPANAAEAAAAPAGGAAAGPAPAVGPKNLLTWSVLLGSAVSGWLGARLRSSRLERSLLQRTLADAVVQPAADPEVKAEILQAPNAVQMSAAALGVDRVEDPRAWPRGKL